MKSVEELDYLYGWADEDIYYEGYSDGKEEQKAIDFAMFQSFLSERGLLFGKYTKANGDTGYKTLDDLYEYFNKKEE